MEILAFGVDNPDGLRPASPRQERLLAQPVRAEAINRGAIVYASGGQDQGDGDLLLLGPPLTITTAEIDEVVTILGDAIAAVTCL